MYAMFGCAELTQYACERQSYMRISNVNISHLQTLHVYPEHELKCSLLTTAAQPVMEGNCDGC